MEIPLQTAKMFGDLEKATVAALADINTITGLQAHGTVSVAFGTPPYPFGEKSTDTTPRFYLKALSNQHVVLSLGSLEGELDIVPIPWGDDYVEQLHKRLREHSHYHASVFEHITIPARGSFNHGRYIFVFFEKEPQLADPDLQQYNLRDKTPFIYIQSDFNRKFGVAEEDPVKLTSQHGSGKMQLIGKTQDPAIFATMPLADMVTYLQEQEYVIRREDMIL